VTPIFRSFALGIEIYKQEAVKPIGFTAFFEIGK